MKTVNSGSSESIEVEALLATSVLDADNVPNKNQSETCFSCESKMVGLYCKDCGQKNDNFRRSIFALGAEAISSIFSLESRMWRTWWTLLSNPGKVAREFADGKRSRWSSPIRVYLAMSLLLFGYIAVTQTQLVSLDVNAQKRESSLTPEANLTLEDLSLKFALRMFETQKQIDERNAQRNFSYINMIFEGEGYNLDLTDEGVIFLPKDETDTTENTDDNSENPSSLSEDMQEDINESEPTAEAQRVITEILQEDISDNQLIVNGQEVELTSDSLKNATIQFMKNPSRFNEKFSKYIPRIMFVMMPFTMFLGALFIRGRGNAYLYDHLVHAAYIHAVIFFVLLFGLLLGRISFISGGFIFSLLLIYLTVYLPVSLYNMFKRGPIKTVWATYSIAFVYLTVMFSVVITLSIMGVADYFTA